MIGLHVSLRCRDLQVILGINFWSMKLAVANDEKENRCICYFKVDFIPICFFILLQATIDAI